MTAANVLQLVLAIGCEVTWALAMKLSDGFRRPLPSTITVVFYVLSLVFLTLASRALPVSVAYAVWAGSGAALIAVAGMLWLGEPVSAGRVISIALIIAGVVGLHLGERG